jgi:hypothetical protein
MKKFKVVNTKPNESIGFELEDGVIKECKICSLAFAILDEEFQEGCVKILMQSFNKPYINVPKIIYAGIKVCDDDINYEQVCAMTRKIELDNIMEIATIALDKFGTDEKKSKSKTTTKKQEKMMKQIIQMFLK